MGEKYSPIYYFGEANTANKSDNQHNNTINENLNWGGFPGYYRLLQYDFRLSASAMTLALPGVYEIPA